MSKETTTIPVELFNRLQLHSDMLHYLGWLEKVRLPQELHDAGYLVLASDGTTCFSDHWLDAVRVAMEHDKEIFDSMHSVSQKETQ